MSFYSGPNTSLYKLQRILLLNLNLSRRTLEAQNFVVSLYVCALLNGLLGRFVFAMMDYTPHQTVSLKALFDVSRKKKTL